MHFCLPGYPKSYTCHARMFTGNEWPSGSYGLPRPKSGCPSGEKNNRWYEGWKLQYMEDVDKSLSSQSRVSNGSHMDVELIENGRNLNRTFCMKENTGIEPRFWPKGNVSALYT